LKQHQNGAKQNALEAIKAAFLDCLSNTTGHGLPQMAKTSNLFLRLLWGVFFLVGVGGAVFLIYQAVDQYLAFGVITTTKIKNEKEMILPAITFCAANETDHEIIPIIQDMVLQTLLINGRSGPMLNFRQSDPTDLEIFDYHLFKNVTCIQLNFGTDTETLTKVAGDGLFHGYLVDFFLPLNTTLYFVITDNNARVVYGEVNEIVFPGQASYIALSKTNQTALGPPYSDCVDTVNYRQMTCTEDCVKKNMSDACGCEYPLGCLNRNEWNVVCSNNNANYNTVLFKCKLRCPVECNQITYSYNRINNELNIEQELVALHAENYKYMIEKKFKSPNMSLDKFKKRLARLYIYFDRLETTEITQSGSMSLTSLIANVGGHLGISNKSFFFLFFYRPNSGNAFYISFCLNKDYSWA